MSSKLLKLSNLGNKYSQSSKAVYIDAVYMNS